MLSPQGRRVSLSRLFRAAGVAVVALSVPLPATENPAGPRPWIRIDAPNVTVFSNASERRTVQLSKSIERFIQVLEIFYPRLTVNTPVPTFVYVFNSDVSLTPYKPLYKGQPQAVAGYFLPSRDGNYITLNGHPRSDPLDVIFHEFTHYFVGNNLPRIPVWFSEGLAECYSTFESDARSAKIGKPIEHHLESLRYHTLLPLEDILAVTHDSELYNHGERRGLFYAQSWALVHYLLWGNIERRPQLVQFMKRIGRGEDSENAFLASFGTTHQALENELRRYIEQRRFHYSLGKFNQAKRIEIDPAVAMKEEDVFFGLGDLLVHFGIERLDEAKEHFRIALEIDPSHAGALAGLGRIERDRENLDEAIGYYEKAVATGGADYLIHFNFAETLARRRRSGHGLASSASGAGADRAGGPSDVERAQEHYRTSIAQNSRFGEAYLGYGRAILYAGGENMASAARLLEAGARLLPARTDVLVNLVILYDATGQHEKAARLVDEVLSEMGDPEALAAARQAIAETSGRPSPHEPEPPGTGAGTDGGDEGRTPEDPVVRPLEPDPTRRPPGSIQGDRIDKYNRRAEIFNEAVAVANKGDLKNAIEILEDLIARSPADDLTEQAIRLVKRMRLDAARMGIVLD